MLTLPTSLTKGQKSLRSADMEKNGGLKIKDDFDDDVESNS